MKNLFLLFLFCSPSLFAQTEFYSWFTDHTMRVDYLMAGDKNDFDLYLYKTYQEPHWGGSETNLADTMNYGNFSFDVSDSVTSRLLYSRSFNTLFREWLTTSEAGRVKKAFKESLVFPYPKNTVRLDVYQRNSRKLKKLKFSVYINPSDILIEQRIPVVTETDEIYISGDPHHKVDIVYLSEGYTTAEKDKFLSDVNRFNRYMFTVNPYSEEKENFNVRSVFVPSEDSGTDNPGKGQWKSTVFNSGFYTFYSERYLTTNDFWQVRNMAAAVPYDQIVVLVNSKKYGGGGIFNQYSLFSADNEASEVVFVHEFGHGFAGLGDEYYTSSVSYNDFYDLRLEPPEPNLTTLVDFGSKWEKMITPGTPIPTPPEEKYRDSVGVFEGGGYIAKGMYRSQNDCSMKSNTAAGFCKVCRKAIRDMIRFYSE